MKDLPENIKNDIWMAKAEGNSLQMRHQYLQAIEQYKIAMDMFPEPKNEWAYIRILWESIAENYFLNRDYEKALDYFREIMKLPGSIGNAEYHRRLGEIRYEIGEMNKARDELMRAYMAEGKEFFLTIDPKYYELIRPIVEG